METKKKKEMINVKELYRRDPETAKKRAERFGFGETGEILIKPDGTKIRI